MPFLSIAFSAPSGSPPEQAAKPPPEAPRAKIPGPHVVFVKADHQESDGRISHLHGAAEVETAEMIIRAEDIEYNEVTGEVRAEGAVKYKSFVTGEQVEAERAEYNVRDETGKFYQVLGQASGKIEARAGLLATENPFIFKGEWAERLKDRYIVHNGFLTNCRLPNPVWTLNGPIFDVVPNNRAIIHRSTFRIRNFPVLYVPVFYKPLTERPRKSGFLTPNAGTSSRRGYMVGTGYYWAINRSSDLMYRTQYFTQRGFAHHVDFRAKPTQSSDIYVFMYGVNDKGLLLDDGRRYKAGGALLTVTANADLGKGFYGRADFNYLSSFQFRQEFTESFNEAVFSEVHSVAFATRNWSSYGLNFLFREAENFHSTEPGDVIKIRKMPAVEFNVRDRQVSERVLPVWVSFDSTLGLLQRDQPGFQTSRFVDRVDIAPRVMTALRWKDFHLLPAFTVRGTHYGATRQDDKPSGASAFRTTGEFSTELIFPSLARVFEGPGWLGEKVKHVIDARAGFRFVDGAGDFNDYIRFDETELVANTSEAEISIGNRVYAKRGGSVREVLTWELGQRYFFDPDFGGAVTAGRRNVVQSSVEMTGYAFLDQPRRYSPITSYMRLSPAGPIGVAWRTDYDPFRHRFVNNGITADARLGRYFMSLGHNYVRSLPVLTANANQFRGLFAIGDQNKRGWNAAFSAIYDFRQDAMQFGTVQLSYNTDCCGFSVQYRRFSFGSRNENQFRVAFAIANIGSFGTLRRQERIF